jgi:energy-coupling factor transporter ATP-binding protein EcfA2
LGTSENILENESLVQIKDLSFQYIGSGTTVLDRINLNINRNEIVLIAGHSGSGKSTLLRAINGLIPHQHTGVYNGEVVVDGLVVSKTSMSDLAKRVGYVFQNPENQIFMFSVERDIAFGLENLRLPQGKIRERVNWAMDLLDISPLATRAPHELSDGQKQRVALAGVIAMEPKLLILDEPTSLLDPFTAKTLVQLVKTIHDKLKIGVILVEHRLDLVVQIATRMLVMESGRIMLDGTPREVLSNTQVNRYGVNEPIAVRLAKQLGIEGQALPLDPLGLHDSLNSRL